MTTNDAQHGATGGLAFERAYENGYRVHQGTAADGELDGTFWWTLMRQGWMEPKTSTAEWETRGDAERAAVAAFQQELSVDVGISTKFATPAELAPQSFCSMDAYGLETSTTYLPNCGVQSTVGETDEYAR